MVFLPFWPPLFGAGKGYNLGLLRREGAAVASPPGLEMGAVLPSPTQEESPPQGHFWHFDVSSELGNAVSPLATASNFPGRMSAQDQKSQ